MRYGSYPSVPAMQNRSSALLKISIEFLCFFIQRLLSFLTQMVADFVAENKDCVTEDRQVLVSLMQEYWRGCGLLLSSQRGDDQLSVFSVAIGGTDVSFARRIE